MELTNIASPRDHPDLGIKPRSPALQADSSLAEVSGKPPLTEKMVKFHFRKMNGTHK